MREITIPGKPIGKGRPRFTRSGRAYTPKSTEDYEKAVRQAYMAKYESTEPYSGAVRLVIWALFPIPKSDSKAIHRLKEENDIRPTKTPDADNICKIVMDGLNGVAYFDDKQVVDLRCLKKYDNNPRVEVHISTSV